MILRALKKNLKGRLGRWADELQAALWTVRTTVRGPTGETPFSLTYGSEAMTPVEMMLPSHRVTQYSEQGNLFGRASDLDLLEERRLEARMRMVNYKQKAKSHHDKRVCGRSFAIGDWVLRKVEATGRRADRGKLSAN